MVYKQFKKISGCVRPLLQQLEFALFPPTCVLCGSAGNTGLDLCSACQRAMPVIASACMSCALPLSGRSKLAGMILDENQRLCGACIRKPHYFDRSYSPYLYAEPVDWLIQQLKFNARLPMIKVLSDLLHQHLLACRTEKPQALLPVPMHPSRQRQRGFNQALEIARPLARYFQVPLLADVCRRQQNTPPQSELPAKKRAANIRNAFTLKKPPAFQHIAIVDDVMTTGATANELARLLKRNGVETVQVWTVARTVLD